MNLNLIFPQEFQEVSSSFGARVSAKLVHMGVRPCGELVNLIVDMVAEHRCCLVSLVSLVPMTRQVPLVFLAPLQAWSPWSP